MTARLWTAFQAVGLTFVVAMLMGCAEPKQMRGPVVLAAASLQEAFEEIGEAWAAQGHPPPMLSFAASSALARQVQQGAPADLFVSADEDWMDSLSEQGLLRPGYRQTIAGNRLVLVRGQHSQIRDLADLGEGRLSLANPEAVPAGKYAKGALEHLGRWDDVADNVVAAENARAALALVERGEAPLGIVYATDAQASRRVAVAETFPAGSHPPIRYPAAVLAGSRHPDAAAFLQFLQTSDARRILVAHGFSAPE